MQTGEDKTGQGYRWVRWEDGYFDPDHPDEPQSRQEWALACAELCGWGHYKMRGRLYVHQTQEDYLLWLRAADYEVHRTRPESTTPPAK
jgi:hypothetical protein